MTAGMAAGYGGKLSVGRTATASQWIMPRPGAIIKAADAWNMFLVERVPPSTASQISDKC